MARDATLDEFGRDGAGDDAGDDGAGTDTDGRADANPESDADPTSGAGSRAPVVCEWTPDGAACEACGATVERRWHDGDVRVCVDCKDW